MLHSGHTRRATLIKRNSKFTSTSNKLSLWRRRYGRSHKCISSKAVLFILFWSFSVSLANNCLFEGANYIFENFSMLPVKYFPLLYALKSLVMVFYPFAGILADTKYSRFKMITRSPQLLLLSIFLTIIFNGIAITGLVLSDGINYLWIFFLCLSVVVSIPTTVLTTASFVMFNANIIQFGVDQLQDSPADHQSLFIYWYVWIYYLGVLVAQIGWSSSSFFIQASYLSVLPIVLSIVLLIIVVLIVHYKKHWFIIDTARTNPYKLVYRVTKFAQQHKVPIHRSAFTYCEDDIPSGLDLGKSKYGGPFTTEEVENVKAFYGIFKILFAFGIALFMNVASSLWLSQFINHVTAINSDDQYFNSFNLTHILLLLLFKDGILSSLVVVLLLPFYVVFIRPFTISCNMRMFRRIGVGIIFLLMSVTSTFVTDTVAHTRNITNHCMLDSGEVYFPPDNAFHPAILLPQRFLYGLSVMMIYPALYEFICAQSPHSMKGLFIGLSFAIRGLSDLLASLLLIPFTFSRLSVPSCGMEYYMMTIVVGVVGLAVYVYVVRKYKLRERDEPCHVHRFVEEYYSKIQEEENY